MAWLWLRAAISVFSLISFSSGDSTTRILYHPDGLLLFWDAEQSALPSLSPPSTCCLYNRLLYLTKGRGRSTTSKGSARSQHSVPTAFPSHGSLSLLLWSCCTRLGLRHTGEGNRRNEVLQCQAEIAAVVMKRP